ncbi:hypothetical protein BDN72DRAFT_849174 [Pluteus cervinus]|uniref:Uncharacterized protein n=1 Tax=Pluteus cervinus TaxID=181527 RepID=A0ACD3A8N8_9AGAR|nr:hypothetical protein BDN72DRAFT_849174 [Pluteus cervinus]
MPTVAQARESNATFKPSYLPVAVFIGGTSGIGQAMVEAFAQYTKGNAHIIIVGRNQAAAEAIIAKLPKPASDDDDDDDEDEDDEDEDEEEWKHEFISCDINLMKNIYEFTADLKKRIDHINFLVLSAGLGEDAKVMSILAAGQGKPVDVDDLGLKKNFSAFQAMLQTATYTDYAFEEFAIREPAISFTHIFPGFVDTPSVSGLLDYDQWVVQLIKPIVTPLIRLFSVPSTDCAERMLYALFNAEKGFNRRNDKGDSNLEDKSGKEEADAEIRKKVWDHSVETTSVGRQ